MPSAVSYHTTNCKIELEVSWEVAEQLAPLFTDLANNLTNALKRNADYKAQSKKLHGYTDPGYSDEGLRMRALAEEASVHSEILVKTGLKRQQAERLTAEEFNIPYTTLAILLLSYRSQQREFLRAQREQDVIRLYLCGFNQSQIARELEIAATTVSRILKDKRDLLLELRSLKAKTRLPEPDIDVRYVGTDLTDEELAKKKRKDAFREETIKRKQYHIRLGTQLYRQCRRKNKADQEQHLQSILVTHPDLNMMYLRHLISVRRVKVQGYLKRRRMQTIRQMHGKGHSQTAIAKTVGLSPATISNYLKAAEAAQIGGQS